MKNLVYVFLGLISWAMCSQNTEEAQVKQAVDDFFSAFHAQDSVALKSVVHPEIVLQTIAKSKEGNVRLAQENFGAFMKSIVSIPDSVSFQERLTGYDIRIDGPMANVWTPYAFWLNDEFHHCGVNSFQLLKEGSAWKIIYLIDTRRKSGCTNETK